MGKTKRHKSWQRRITTLFFLCVLVLLLALLEGELEKKGLAEGLRQDLKEQMQKQKILLEQCEALQDSIEQLDKRLKNDKRTKKQQPR